MVVYKFLADDIMLIWTKSFDLMLMQNINWDSLTKFIVYHINCDVKTLAQSRHGALLVCNADHLL